MPDPDPRTVLASVVVPDDPAVLPLVVDGERPDTPTSAVPLDRRRLLVPAGTTASFATWWSAFPAGWWAAHTGLRSVRLEVETTGPATVRVSRSDGTPLPWPGELPLGDGLLWFDVTAGDGDVVLERADWCGDPVEPGGATACITTFDRPRSLLGLLHDLARCGPELDAVVVVDQGTRRVRDEPGFAVAQAALGGRLRVVEQGNLGGSGGFARGMLEALGSSSRYALLLDDDVDLDAEAVRRAVAFADRCSSPAIVAGAMLDARRRTVLHSPGERVDPRRFLWETVPPGRPDHDLARGGPRSVPWLSQRLDVQFGAWWCCLLPLEVVRRIGLPLPLFLKWDDVETGLRAGRAGVPTVALPGVGVWHEPWTGKSDTLDWQAYFHHRNRFVAALRTGHRRPLRLVAEGVEHSLRPLATGRRSVAALRAQAVRDVLAGPDDLLPSLATRRAEVVALQRRYADDDGPGWPPCPPLRTAPLRRLRDLARLVVLSARVPDRGLVLDTLRLHARLVLTWPRLRRAYRAADLTSETAWRSVLHPGRVEPQ